MKNHEDYLNSKYLLCVILIREAKKVLKLNKGKDIVFTTNYNNERRDKV